MERFDCENLFKQALCDGINIFCGAGFSIKATDKQNKALLLGNALLDELKKEFETIGTYTSLPRACSKLKQTNKTKFYEFLNKKFSVNNFDLRYMELTKINIFDIYTTNIDDLFFKIYDKCEQPCYLNDKSVTGTVVRDNSAVNYFPLHGCVRHRGEYIFGATDIASAFSQKNTSESWKQLAVDASKNAILFWGWNFEDAGPIEAMYGGEHNIEQNIKRWVLLYNPKNEIIDYLDSLGFNIIIGSTDQMLTYLSKFNDNSIVSNNNTSLSEKNKRKINDYLPPKIENITTYPLDALFLDYTPRWSHIYTNTIPKTQHYREIADSIIKGQNMIVYGIRGAGKSTLMMQLLINLEINRPKYYMSAPSLGQAKNFAKILNNSDSLLFIDDCFRDTEAIIELCRYTNIQIIAFDRDFSFENQFSKLDKSKFSIPLDITRIEEKDAQSILNIIPNELKKQGASTTNFGKDPTIPNLLAANLKAINFNFIQKFYQTDHEAAEVFLMICYVHSCGVPCSFDMVYSYLGDDKYNWQDMEKIVKRVGKLIKDSSPIFKYYNIDPSGQEYYECRSRFFAEKIINSIPKGAKTFAKVLFKFTRDVPIHKICLYDRFKRSGYDADLTSKAFPVISDGEQYYDLCCQKDESEYIYQQAAIYFSRQKEYKKAFEWIDKARNLTHYNRFSIDSTYAKIYFDVNLNVNKELAKSALKILDTCCTKDKRKAIHFLTFARCTLEFWNKYPDQTVQSLIYKAIDYVTEGLKESTWGITKKNKYQLKEIKKSLENVVKKF